MCTGTALLFKIPTIIIGENTNFKGAEDLFTRAGVQLINLDDGECKSMMRIFISQHPDLWNEDIGRLGFVRHSMRLLPLGRETILSLPA
jgi:cytosine deaminase